MPKATCPTSQTTKKTEDSRIPLPIKKRKQYKKKKKVKWNQELRNYEKANLLKLGSSASRVPTGKSILKPRMRVFKKLDAT